jgi:hypothetical protein
MDQPTAGWRVQLDRNSRLDETALRGELSHSEYLGAETWRKTHQLFLKYLENPENYSDEAAATIEANYKRAVEILTGGGKHRRVYHAVCAVCTYGESDELGDAKYTLDVAKVGFRLIAEQGKLEPPPLTKAQARMHAAAI